MHICQWIRTIFHSETNNNEQIVCPISKEEIMLPAYLVDAQYSKDIAYYKHLFELEKIVDWAINCNQDKEEPYGIKHPILGKIITKPKFIIPADKKVNNKIALNKEKYANRLLQIVERKICQLPRLDLINKYHFELLKHVLDIISNMVPNSYLVHFHLGNLYTMRGKYSLAIKEMNESLNIKPSPLASNALADIYVAKGEFKEAAICYTKCIEKARRCPWFIYYNYGCLMENQRSYAVAQEAFKKTLEIVQSERSSNQQYNGKPINKFIIELESIIDDVNARCTQQYKC